MVFDPFHQVQRRPCRGMEKVGKHQIEFFQGKQRQGFFGTIACFQRRNIGFKKKSTEIAGRRFVVDNEDVVRGWEVFFAGDAERSTLELFIQSVTEPINV